MATIDFESFRPTRRMTPDEVVDAAHKLGVPADGVPVEELRVKVKATLEDLLRNEVNAACESWNEWHRESGLPFAEYRRF